MCSDPDPAMLQAASRSLMRSRKSAVIFSPVCSEPTGKRRGTHSREPPLDRTAPGKLAKGDEISRPTNQCPVRQRLIIFAAQGNEATPSIRQNSTGCVEQLALSWPVLSPEQLDEYLLRYSRCANTLRNELRGLNVSPEEFRSLFRARVSD